MGSGEADKWREEFRRAEAFAQRVAAYMRLVHAPDVRWEDLLDGLDHDGLIAEQSSIRLSLALGYADRLLEGLPAKSTWEKRMKGIDPQSRVADYRMPWGRRLRKILRRATYCLFRPFGF
jgi:hypothetical protein